MSRFSVIHDSSPRASKDMTNGSSDTKLVWPVAGLVLSVSAVLLSQFVLETAADTSTIVHWIQHGLLFGGGVGSGLAINVIRIAGQVRA
jgi:hypothetical protein